ncbi:hypothetical protein [Pseudorhodoferax sp.]|uniref:hypothetical protein n=1 Tax=Pseudorhodoferax sp. TaxID=1993553 RepID=UPI0039E6DFE6
MCTGAELLLAAGSAAAGTVASALLSPKTPSMPDPEAERRKAEATATQNATAKLAASRKAMRDNSLLTGAGEGTGRTTLGV